MPASVKRPAKAKSAPKDPKTKDRKKVKGAVAAKAKAPVKAKAPAKAAAKAAAPKAAKKPASKTQAVAPAAKPAAKAPAPKAAAPRPAPAPLPKAPEVKAAAAAPQRPLPVKPLPVKPTQARPQDPGPRIMPKVQPPAVVAEEDVDYAAGDYVVYPTHGVGRVLGIELQEVSGHKLKLIAIKFEKDRMTLRVPVAKAQQSGLRKLSTRKVMDSALAALKGKSRVKRTMWSRRAQEYEAKINSGDPVSIAEVVRDLHRGSDQPDQSYSERQMYQAALDRLAREFAAVEKIDEVTAAERLEQLLKAA
jgi:CarD family transcriptional regulator